MNMRSEGSPAGRILRAGHGEPARRAWEYAVVRRRVVGTGRTEGRGGDGVDGVEAGTMGKDLPVNLGWVVEVQCDRVSSGCAGIEGT